MALTYILKRDRVVSEDKKKFTVYGIRAKNSAGEIVEDFPDIFFDKREALKFIKLCNLNDVPLQNIQELAEEQLK